MFNKCSDALLILIYVSAVITTTEIANCDESFNSTHGGNPLGVAASLECLKIIDDENLVEESFRKGKILESELLKWQCEMPQYISKIYCKGLILWMHDIIVLSLCHLVRWNSYQHKSFLESSNWILMELDFDGVQSNATIGTQSETKLKSNENIHLNI